jgi:hypothetical protein
MSVERRSEREPDRRGRRSGDADEFWSDLGVDVEGMTPKAQAVTGLVVGGAILAGAALVLALNPAYFWMIFIFGWILFPALGVFARGVAGLMDSRPASRPEDVRERELLEALRERGELTPAQAAMETSLTVAEADALLKKLAEGGHLDVRVRGGGLFYALWEYEADKVEGK